MLTLIDDFFGITYAFERELKMASKIKKAYKRMKKRKTLKKFHKSVFKAIGYRVELNELPDELIIFILSFLEKHELYIISQLNRQFNEVAFSQSLWKSYQLKNQNKMFNINRVLPSIMIKLENLHTLNFSF